MEPSCYSEGSGALGTGHERGLVDIQQATTGLSNLDLELGRVLQDMIRAVWMNTKLVRIGLTTAECEIRASYHRPGIKPPTVKVKADPGFRSKTRPTPGRRSSSE